MLTFSFYKNLVFTDLISKVIEPVYPNSTFIKFNRMVKTGKSEYMERFIRGEHDDFISTITNMIMFDENERFGLMRFYTEDKFAKRKVIWFDDFINDGCLTMQSTKECLYVIILKDDEGSLIRFLDPVILEKIAPDITFMKEIRHLAKYND